MVSRENTNASKEMDQQGTETLTEERKRENRKHQEY